MDEIEQKSQAKNTKKKQSAEKTKFENWCEKKKITVDLKTVSQTRLSEILGKFFAWGQQRKAAAEHYY